MSSYNNMAFSMSSGIFIKDPASMAYKFVLPDEDKRATMVTLVEYYRYRGTIPDDEAERMKELIESPDDENMTVVQTILEQKYKLF